METHHTREDISKFLIHLTRNSGGNSARDNLISILKEKEIEARNFHCLFSPKLKKLHFTELLKSKFKTVCFTETPLTQIKNLTKLIANRRIHLKPYGLVFWKSNLIKYGATPAIYVNSHGSKVREFLLKQFDIAFEDARSWKALKTIDENHLELVQYFSSINVISDRHNFLWEREWRHYGSFKFSYREIVAIIAEDTEEFLKLCDEKLSANVARTIRKIPIIHPDWSYEEVIESLSIQIWESNQS